MDTYIGLDAHASSCTLGVLGPGGKRLGSHVVETNAKALIEGLRSIPGISASAPGGRHTGELVVRGTLAACGGACSDGGEREPWSAERQAFGVAERLRIMLLSYSRSGVSSLRRGTESWPTRPYNYGDRIRA